jgi:hypothetical protein
MVSIKLPKFNSPSLPSPKGETRACFGFPFRGRKERALFAKRYSFTDNAAKTTLIRFKIFTMGASSYNKSNFL